MKSSFSAAVASLVALSLAASPLATAAAATRYFAEGAIPTPIEVARAMAGPQFVPKLKMRGLAVPAHSPSEPSLPSLPSIGAVAIAMASTPQSTVTPAPASTAADKTLTSTRAQSDSGVLAMAIPFSFDSARLAPSAAPALDSVAEGLKLLGENARIVIEGHTDAAGSSGYNLKLSKQRAQSVKRYLVVHHGILPRTLVTLGKGQSEPLSGLQTTSKENRRVQFRLA